MIPSSEDHSEALEGARRRGRVSPIGPALVAAGLLVAIAIATTGGSGAEDSDGSAPAIEPFQAPAEVVSFDPPTGPFHVVTAPGRGSVVARQTVGGTETLVIGSSDTASTIWQLEDGVWTIRESFAGLDLRDAVAFGDQMVVVGRSVSPDRRRTVYAGTPGAMEPVQIALVDNEYGYRAEVAGGAVFVFTRTSGNGPDDAAVGTGTLSVADSVDHSVMWSTDGRSFSRLSFDAGGLDVGVYDVLATPDGLTFYGHLAGTPAAWVLDRRRGEWRRLPTWPADNSESHRVVSVAESPDGRRLALAVDLTDGPRESTEVWDVTGSRWERLTDLGVGVYDELISIPGGWLAVPESGASPATSADGLEWSRIGVETRDGTSEMRLEEVVVAPDGQVEILGMLIDGRVPAIWSEQGTSLRFELPADEWSEVAAFQTGDYVMHLSDTLQVVWDGGAVLARPDWASEFEETDLSSLLPVYAVDSVAELPWGQAAVAVSASHTALVVSDDGVEWEVAVSELTSSATDFVPVLALHDDEAMVIALSEGDVTARLVRSDSVSEFVVPADSLGQAFGWVDRLGYTIVESSEGTTRLLSTRDGSDWEVTTMRDRLDSPVILDGRLVGKIGDAWIEHVPHVGSRAFEVPGPFADGALWGDGLQAAYSEDGARWLTDDLETWHPLDLGLGGPAHGYVARAWLTETAIVVESYQDTGPVLYTRRR